MNWDALGAFAELIGSVAVLVTLGYLAVQVRHSRNLLEENRKIALGQVYQARSNTRREYQQQIAESTHLAGLLARVGFDGSVGFEEVEWDSFDDEGRVRLRAHYSTIYFHQENNLYQYELGLLDDRTYRLTIETIQFFMPFWRKLNIKGTGSIEDLYEEITASGT
jgi:hypothetical protein